MFNNRISTVLFTSFKLILISPMLPAVALAWVCYSIQPATDEDESQSQIGEATQPRSDSFLLETPQSQCDSFLVA